MPKKSPPKASAKPNADASASYDAKDIYVLEGLEPVRKRPGMYIGSTGTDGLHHLIWEVFDNSLDEAMAGHAKNITVELLPKNQVAVTDDGRGIPVDIHKQTKVSALETVMTTLHAGGKFGGESYKVSAGLHGVGVSVVNALSEWLRVEVSRGGELYMQEYVRGVPKAKVKKIGKSTNTGTKVIFSPDPQIFQTIEFNEKRIMDHLRQQAYLTRGVRINVLDRRHAPPSFYGFYFEGGIRSFVEHLASDEKPLQEEIFYAKKEQSEMEVEVGFLYVDDIEVREMSFANNVYTPDGGMHLTGFRSALTRSINSYARAEGYLKEKDENVTSEDTREGLVAVVSVKIRNSVLQFEGQTKARLGNPEARTATEAVVNDALKEFLEKHPQEARRIVEKVLLAVKARLAAKAAKDTVLRKGALDGASLPGKLADCSSRSAEESELFLVEGDSAGGCFSGNTKVELADGRNVSFAELVQEEAEGKKNFCYTVQKNGSIGIAPVMNARVTKKGVAVIKVILENGEEVICTPDHQFMLRDGSYKKAHELTPQDSLMPLYRKFSKMGGKITIEGYEMVFQPKSHYWQFTHMLADDFNVANGAYRVEDGSHRHHKDFNKRNNNPDNLIRLTPEGHMGLHRRHAEKTLRRPDVLEKVRLLHATPEFREKIRSIMAQPKMRSLLSARAKKQWENKEYKKFMTERFLEFYRTNVEYRKVNNEQLRKAQEEYWHDKDNVRLQSERVRAHFEKYPEKKIELSKMAREQWANNNGLRKWRAEKTKEQWTKEFRVKRYAAYNRTYRESALKALYEMYLKEKTISQERYEELRAKTHDKNLLKYETLVARFFENDRARLEVAVTHYNHRIKEIIQLDEKMDVYDIEVSGTHNFALASGVFVHNSAKSGRDRRTQAILPVKGKILNVEKSRLDKMLANVEIRSLVIALGTAISENFDLEKLRYHKIIIMSDADVDGAHIRTLFLTLFYRHFPQIIEGGFLYIAQPPLYRVAAGKDVRYAFSDTEKEKVIAELLKAKSDKKGKTGKKEEVIEVVEVEEVGEGDLSSEALAKEGIKGVSVQRYKGLGEMNPEQLWETTMNPENRVLKQVTVEDASAADRLFNILMGDQVDPRKQFIQAHAASVQNLDV